MTVESQYVSVAPVYRDGLTPAEGKACRDDLRSVTLYFDTGVRLLTAARTTAELSHPFG